MEIKEGVHTFNLEWTEGEPLSVHIIKTPEATVLFGAGDEYTFEELVEIAREHNVDVVIVEHGDVDHYEGVPHLQDELGIEVAIPEGDAKFLHNTGIETDYELEEGETYWGIETIYVPGHTPENMAYIYEDVLIAGDTVVGSDSVFAAEGDWEGDLAVIKPEWNEDEEQMKKSVENLLDYEFNVVLVTHGSNVLEAGQDEVQKLVDKLNM